MESFCGARRARAHLRSVGAARARRSIALFYGVAACLSAGPALSQTESQIRTQQEMLIWTTDYEGRIDGKAGEETLKAINKFQDRLKHPMTGRLTPAEEEALVKLGRTKKEQAGWRQITDTDAGVSIGVPLSFVSSPTKTKWGTHWYSRTAGLAIDTLRIGGNTSLRRLYDRLISINNRTVSYQRFIENNWFVIAAFEGEAAVYVRADVVTLPNQQSEIRGFSIWMSKERPKDYEAIPPAMLSSFRPTADGRQIAVGRPPAVGGPYQRPPPNLRQNVAPPSPAANLVPCLNGLGDCPRALLSFRPPR